MVSSCLHSLGGETQPVGYNNYMNKLFIQQDYSQNVVI